MRQLSSDYDNPRAKPQTKKVLVLDANEGKRSETKTCREGVHRFHRLYELAFLSCRSVNLCLYQFLVSNSYER